MPLTTTKKYTGGKLREVVTIDDLAEHFGVTKRAIEYWLEGGRFPQPLRIGRRRRVWDVERLNEWIIAGMPANPEGE
ncbi:MAG: MerR family transcriptional regulator [Planctomycetota bacterium]